MRVLMSRPRGVAGQCFPDGQALICGIRVCLPHLGVRAALLEASLTQSRLLRPLTQALLLHGPLQSCSP